MPSTSSKQANIFRMAYAIRKGSLERSQVDKSVLDIVDGDMCDSQIKHFTQVKESKISLSNYIIEAWSGVKKHTNNAEIEAWCEEMGIKNYTINSKGEIDVDDDVDLSGKNFKELPYKFGRVTGYFNLQKCLGLTSLKNCPNYVGNIFGCGFCPQLDSLKGCPIQVGGYFGCNGCKNLISLEGCPKKVGRDFLCYDCKKKFTKEEVESLCKVKRNILV